MTKTMLGKIVDASFGFGGYDGAQIGLSITFGGKSWGTHHFDGQWANRPESAQWSEHDRLIGLGGTVMRLKELLEKAKVKNVAELVGVPVEVTFENNTLVSFRILEEVL